MEKAKSIALLSGGMDSTVAYYWALEHTIMQKVLFFDFGQRNVIWERKAVHNIVARHAIHEIRLPNIWSGSRKPARNMVFIAYATAVAGMSNSNMIIGGWSAVDAPDYPDCTPEFLSAAGVAASAALGRRVEVYSPVLYMPKYQIVDLGNSFGVPWDLTRSCYTRSEQPCGECDACKHRKEGFKYGKDIP